MPDTITLNSLYFKSGKLELSGSAATDDLEAIYAFNGGLRRATKNGKDDLLFTDVGTPKTVSHGDKTEWSFTSTARDTETPEERFLSRPVEPAPPGKAHHLRHHDHRFPGSQRRHGLAAFLGLGARSRRSWTLRPLNCALRTPKLPATSIPPTATRSNWPNSSATKKAASPRWPTSRCSRKWPCGRRPRNGGVDINSSAAGPAALSTNEFFDEQTLVVTFEAQESNLVNFLYNVGNDPSMVRIRELRLNPADTGRYKLKGTLLLAANYEKHTPVAPAAAQPAAKPGLPAGKPASATSQPERRRAGRSRQCPSDKIMNPKRLLFLCALLFLAPSLWAGPESSASDPSRWQFAQAQPAAPVTIPQRRVTPGIRRTNAQPAFPSFPAPPARSTPPSTVAPAAATNAATAAAATAPRFGGSSHRRPGHSRPAGQCRAWPRSLDDRAGRDWRRSRRSGNLRLRLSHDSRGSTA